MNTKHILINGDSRQMDELADGSVHLVVTSPPYWQLKDYGSAEQIGFHDSYENYVNHLNLVWNQCYRVLHPGCRLCINIGDQFARAVYYGRYKVIPIRQEIIKFCETIGFDYMGAIIWQKVTTSNTTGGGVQMGSYPYPRNGILKLDYEFILIFKKLGQAPKPTIQQKEQSKLTEKEWNTYFSGHWNFAGVRQEKHLAMFPEELPKRLIKMFCFVGETVLDPFAGSGTTALAALNTDRNSFGYEINPDYSALVSPKLTQNSQARYEFELRKQTLSQVDFEAQIQKLPYQFKDPHLFNKKLNFSQKGYGSKISHETQSLKPELFNVKQVLNADQVLLSNGQVLKLLGIKPIPEKNTEAVEFLTKKTKGKKVFFKPDENQPKTQPISAYLYLENKTFLNAHLLKNGLADVELESSFKLKDKFIKLIQNTDKQ